MNADVAAKLAAALRSGDYTQGGRGRMSEGEQPGTHEFAGVLCLLAVKAEVIPPPTFRREGDDIVWLYKGNAGDDALPSCINIPDAVLKWAGMSLHIGDPLVIKGEYHTWTGHTDAGVTFAEFADALKARPTEEATAA